MKSKILVVVILLAVLGAGGVYLAANKSTTNEDVANEQSNTKSAEFIPESFQNIKAAHYVSSNPSNNALLNSSVDTVAIKFNFDLAPPSKINVTLNGADVTKSATSISSDKLTLTIPVTANQTGNYKVEYAACWPDGSCHDGSYGFSIKLP
ncbi:copper resistance protein CopC [Candidatus Saccharibacteria bacterium]|nr:copper resistance protein CopC [Candidatus Saccharibacteria bacterium]